MKKQLAKMERASLEVIARDISIAYTSQEETAAKVAEYYRNYGIRWDDLVARYGIESNKITHR